LNSSIQNLPGGLAKGNQHAYDFEAIMMFIIQNRLDPAHKAREVGI